MDDLSTPESLEKFHERSEKPDNRNASLDQIQRHSPVRASFLGLPFEIRLQIYRYCIFQKRIVEIVSTLPFMIKRYDDTLDLNDCIRNDNKNNLLLVSKQISEESLNVLYGENLFNIHLHRDSELWLKKTLAGVNRRRIRYLTLVARPQNVPDNPVRTLDNELWSSFLSGLNGLRIIAEQPLQTQPSSTPKQELECWLKWIRPLVECFGQHLSTETAVQVDANGREETTALFKKYIPNGYSETRSLFGDFVFKRAQFSPGSGYWDMGRLDV